MIVNPQTQIPVGGGKMDELNPVVIAGAVLSAFMVGSSIFFAIGRAVQNSKLKAERDRAIDAKKEMGSRVGHLNQTIDEAKLRIRDLELAGQTPPSPVHAKELVATLLRGEEEIWLSNPVHRPREHDKRVAHLRTKIVSIANLKGGVGKTTLAANLAAYFDLVLGKRVLVIDADYQGSLTAIMKRLANSEHAAVTTSHWLQEPKDFAVGSALANPAGASLPKTKFLSAFYELSNVETRLMIEWLLGNMLGDSSTTDLRYVLARTLHSEAVQSQFDIVLIDCPPRMSTATVNALCASTHLLIPTVVDRSSLEAVENFVSMYRSVTARLNHNIRLLGVAPILTENMALKPEERSRLEDLQRRVRLWGGVDALPIFDRNIPRKTPIANIAGTGIALIRSEPRTKRLFREFGEEVAARLESGEELKAVAAE